jgi:hypothetical protein
MPQLVTAFSKRKFFPNYNIRAGKYRQNMRIGLTADRMNKTTATNAHLPLAAARTSLNCK